MCFYRFSFHPSCFLDNGESQDADQCSVNLLFAAWRKEQSQLAIPFSCSLISVFLDDIFSFSFLLFWISLPGRKQMSNSISAGQRNGSSFFFFLWLNMDIKEGEHKICSCCGAGIQGLLCYKISLVRIWMSIYQSPVETESWGEGG